MNLIGNGISFQLLSTLFTINQLLSLFEESLPATSIFDQEPASDSWRGLALLSALH